MAGKDWAGEERAGLASVSHDPDLAPGLRRKRGSGGANDVPICPHSKGSAEGRMARLSRVFAFADAIERKGVLVRVMRFLLRSVGRLPDVPLCVFVVEDKAEMDDQSFCSVIPSAVYLLQFPPVVVLSLSVEGAELSGATSPPCVYRPKPVANR